MIRLKIVVEGHTEREFIKRVLAPSLGYGRYSVKPIVVSNTPVRQSQDHLGGGHFGNALRDIRNALEDQSAYCTTMFDYYGLPDDFPGLTSDDCPPPSQLDERIDYLERSLGQEIGDTHRFLPYLQVHEFEALLFSSVETIDDALQTHGSVESRLHDLRAIVNHFDHPERIDDDPETAPSKRLQDLFPRYDKMLHGEMIAHDIGLSRIRDACPHFDDWVTRLDSLEPLNA
jgi:hypothetical protein